MATRADKEELRARIEADPRNYIAQPILALSTAPTLQAGAPEDSAPLKTVPL